MPVMSDIWDGLSDTFFDEADRDLFGIHDIRLRADAIRYSILPRLHSLFEVCVRAIHRIYGLDPFEDSIRSYYPHFRLKRDKEIGFHYDAAYVSIGGKRSKTPMWHGLARDDGKPVQIIPVRFGFHLTQNGLSLTLENWKKKLTEKSYRKFFEFNIEQQPILARLCHSSAMYPVIWYGKGLPPISSFRDHYHFMIENKIHLFSDFFLSDPVSYPIHATSGQHSITSLARRFVSFYPVYDSYIQISKGEPIRFHALIEKLNAFILDSDWNENQCESGTEATAASTFNNPEMSQKALHMADRSCRVMSAKRWRVFQRDGWRCVACGRGANQEVILHVDHILPRSHGGSDKMDNLQTLCQDCNLGKGNRDTTDLRVPVNPV